MVRCSVLFILKMHALLCSVFSEKHIEGAAILACILKILVKMHNFFVLIMRILLGFKVKIMTT